MIQIDWQSRTPIYDQLVRGVVRLKMLGVLQPGDQLPSVRNLAAQLGVNPNTVQKAYQLLETQNVIYSVSGKGSFISAMDSASAGLLAAAESRVKNILAEAMQTGVSRETILHLVNEIYREGSEQHD